MATGLFLDFDGVLCDSVSECYASSWIAFFERYRGESPKSVRIEDYRLFRSYRPYIHRGEDYLLIHSLISDRVPIRNQADFDAAVARAGTEHMATYRALLYTVREQLVADSLDRWLALHTAYPGIRGPLAALAPDPYAWIVSTKRQEFVLRVLRGWGIQWPPDRIATPVSRTKMQIIEGVIHTRRLEKAIFVDDHAGDLYHDHIEGLYCRLATWGHVDPNILNSDDYDRIELPELISIMQERASK
jgi:phosphoglycolate phosphatase-like HAD superfamily hydrolase